MKSDTLLKQSIMEKLSVSQVEYMSALVRFHEKNDLIKILDDLSKQMRLAQIQISEAPK